jgi:hypothetical protein
MPSIRAFFVLGLLCTYTNIQISVYVHSLTGKPDLKPNQAVCFNCGNVLTSNSQYDMVVCSCGAMGVDGGYHLRIIGLKENPARIGDLAHSADDAFTVKFYKTF